MMRALYSGVSGLKTHQTKMDVIGNNIANVNTVGFKSTSVTFQELMYQTTQSASGAQTNGRGGVNAKQIGLGSTTGATKINITSEGATQTTGDGFDLKITNSDSFFIVSDGTNKYFTKAGSFYVDGAGNLCMTSSGYNVMGWQVDPETGEIQKDVVSALQIMNAKNMTSQPEATTNGYASGIMDKNDVEYSSTSGKIMTLSFYDALGFSYTAKFSVKSTDTDGEYSVELTDILDSNGKSIKDSLNASLLSDVVNFGSNNTTTKTELYSLVTGVTYDNVNKIYGKTVTAVEDVCSNDKGKMVKGLSYGNVTWISETAAPYKVEATGTGTLTKEDLEGEPYYLTYMTTNLDGSNYTTSPGGYYVQVDKTTGKTYIITNEARTVNDYKGANFTGRTEDYEIKTWDSMLGTTGAVVTEADTGVNITVTQEFTTDDDVKYDDATLTFTKEVTQAEAYGITEDPTTTYSYAVSPDGQAQVTTVTSFAGGTLVFDTDTGKFKNINGSDSMTLDFNTNYTDKAGTTKSLKNFSDVSIDFSAIKWLDNNGKSTVGLDPGLSTDDVSTGKGKMLGKMTGVSVSQDGKIYGAYDNGNTELLGQIAVAAFANPSGLEKIGDNLYSTTLNSGEFDGIGQEITSDGGKIVTGALEMSNVDLATEFTEMITTQRGYQANSRIITTSDTLLEELINLKR
ncbi:flagellar hook-basal body protein [Acetitomaculum ruminis DSM 5522]|uniref:Flagellar hook protein FlgE n=1 Tax=Acetitomaculum ruminis DSM 5522 TaxID=1120918 RepID=A0A1I0ZH70_9FIRM|nr:flagellar hook-basal body complex protein [Acetitomaculum ruminis]SFB25109.1 flagellar hook-basal body protein [Acetitomaculum ruminis DSM 5522]